MRNANGVVDSRLGPSTALLALGLAVFTGSARGQSLEPAFAIIEQAVADGEIPGASALIRQNGQEVAHRAFGLRDVKLKRPFRNDTVGWIAVRSFTVAKMGRRSNTADTTRNGTSV
jgi:hypothetical protein